MKNESVGEDFPRQQARLRELMEQYASIGPGGTFGLIILKAMANRAEEAIASGDIVAILKSYAEMKECK